MFSRDIANHRMAPRTLQSSKFGPYSRLSVDAKRDAKGWLWAIAYGIAIGFAWWAVVAIKAGMQ